MRANKALASMGAVFALAALVTACAPGANDNGTPVETKAAPEAVLDMTQPIDQIVLTSAYSGTGVTQLDFSSHPVTLAVCKRIAEDSVVSSSRATTSCLYEGKYKGAFFASYGLKTKVSPAIP